MTTPLILRTLWCPWLQGTARNLGVTLDDHAPHCQSHGTSTTTIWKRRHQRWCERILANVCSLDNKLGYLRLHLTTQHEMKECCVFIFMLTRLHENITNLTIQLNGLTSFDCMTVKCLPFYLTREFTTIIIVAVYIPLDQAYSNFRDSYKATSHHHLNYSDHISVMLMNSCL